jgi:outer membrane protein OmpA-like peptidoglycan-associated protein/Mg-chelatase subunit ChlD
MTTLRRALTFVGVCAMLALVSGCGAVKSITGGEPAAKEDAIPPPDYDPHYIHDVKALPADPAQVHHAILEISRIDAREPNKVRIYAQLIDTNGFYLSGAALAKYKGKWCTVNDQTGTQTPINITKYRLKEVTETQRVPTAVAIVMDHSGSMGEERAQVVEQAAADLIDKKRPEDAFAMIKYDDKVKVEAPLTTNGQELKLKLVHEGLTGYGGTTAILDALDVGLKQLESAPTQFANHAVALFTDGQDNSSTITHDSLMHAARHSNASLCLIGFGDNVDEAFLKDIASSTGGLFRHCYRTKEIEAVFTDLYKRLRNYYVFEYTPPSYGVHSVTLKLCLPNETVSATGTYDNTPNIGDIAKMDVYFDLNSSQLLPTSSESIDNAVTLLKAFPKLSFEVRGHTDSTNNTKDPEFNTKLSQKRAEIVKAALIKKGISNARIKAIGYGATMPVADNSSEDGRALNRRTEFVVE